MVPTRSLLSHVLVLACLALAGCASPNVSESPQERAAEPATAPLSAADAYMEFRVWINAQPEELRAREHEEVLAAYSDHLVAQGFAPEGIAQRRELLQNSGESQEVELWNRVLTSDTPRFNTDPNEFLVRMVADREPGRALDVGMGQGRNAIWLASMGWEVTGFDPADQAVALAVELAADAGVQITTEVVDSEHFDWGTERGDLIVLSYVSARDDVDTILQALTPGWSFSRPSTTTRRRRAALAAAWCGTRMSCSKSSRTSAFSGTRTPSISPTLAAVKRR
ncbi:MAG: SAM-dependent methyltransferase [Chlamydiales bacterium]|jgi:SAM-dependent methyltransferase